jgi:hypothetical protein
MLVEIKKKKIDKVEKEFNKYLSSPKTFSYDSIIPLKVEVEDISVEDLDIESENDMSYEEIIEDRGITLSSNTCLKYVEFNDIDSFMTELQLKNNIKHPDKRQRKELELQPYNMNIKGRFVLLDNNPVNLDLILKAIELDSPRIVQNNFVDKDIYEYYNLWKPYTNVIDANLIAKYNREIAEILGVDTDYVYNLVCTIRKQQAKYIRKFNDAIEFKKEKRKARREKLLALTKNRPTVRFKNGEELKTSSFNLKDLYESCFDFDSRKLDRETFVRELQKRIKNKNQTFIVADNVSPMFYKAFKEDLDFVCDTLRKYDVNCVAGLEKTANFNLSEKTIQKELKSYLRRCKKYNKKLTKEDVAVHTQYFYESILPAIKERVGKRREQTLVRSENIQATLIKNTAGKFYSWCNKFVTSPNNKIIQYTSEGKIKEAVTEIPKYKGQHIVITRNKDDMKLMIEYQLWKGKLGIRNILSKLKSILYIKDTTDKIKNTLWCIKSLDKIPI